MSLEQFDEIFVIPLTTNQILSQAEIHRQEISFPFIAITGSNGKTTTKSMLQHILQQTARVYAFDSYSDTAAKIATELLSLADQYDWALVKIGAATPDEVKISANLIRPHVGIITNIGEAHLERHGSVENIAIAKEALLKALGDGGMAVLNRDNEFTRAMGDAVSGKVVYFGLSSLADYYASDIEHLGPNGTSFQVHKPDHSAVKLTLPIYSLGDIYNTLAAYATASELGVDSTTIAKALQTDFILPNGRGRLYAIDGLLIIDDTYDATPQSLYKSSKSLVNFRNYSERLILVMGDMSELGSQASNMHAMMGHYLAAMPIDIIVLVGENVLTTATALRSRGLSKQQVIQTATTAEAAHWFNHYAQKGDTIMIEGSNAIDMSAIVKGLVELWQEKIKSQPAS